MTKTNKEVAELLLEDAFAGLLSIAQREGITVKRMRELLSRTQVHAMREQGMTQQEIMAASGYSLKTIRRLLQSVSEEDNTDLINRFIGDWSSDSEFPAELPISALSFPTFQDLCARYAGDFTPPSLLQILSTRGLVRLDENLVVLQSKALTPPPGLEMLEFARQSINSLLCTLDHNLAGQQPALLERRLWSHRMPVEHVAELRERVSEHAQALRLEILAELDRLESKSTADTVYMKAVGLGLYWFEMGDESS